MTIGIWQFIASYIVDFANIQGGFQIKVSYWGLTLFTICLVLWFKRSWKRKEV